MGLFDKIFGKTKSISSILIGTRTDFFRIYGITQPSDAQEMKASVYLCICGVGILNAVGGGNLKDAIDKVVADTRELVTPLTMRVAEVANTDEQLEIILKEFPGRIFPAEIDITESTTINGLAAFEALFFSIGQALILEISCRLQAPGGPQGYAAIVLADGVFGEGEATEHLMALWGLMSKFLKELSEAALNYTSS